MEKVDVKKSLARYRAVKGRFDVVDVPEARYLMVDGHGDPNTTPAYADALAALYAVAYAVKFASRSAVGIDYVVPPLEGLWWAEDISAFARRDKAQWSWTMMILLPDGVGDELVADAVARMAEKDAPVRLADVRIEALTEGLCVQTLHVGPFDEEGPVLERLHHEFLPAHGYRPSGKHHEIYLSDARRVAPEKLRTILRQPVTAV